MLLPERVTLLGRWRLGTSMARVGLYKSLEKYIEPRATHYRDVPTSPATFTAEWLTEVMCRDVPNASVEAFELGRGSSGATDRQALTLRYNDAGIKAGLPSAVFCKYSNSVQQRLWLGNSGLMQHEVAFYREMRAEMNIETPQSYHVAYHPRGWQSAVILEDLDATKGATFCAPSTPMTKEMICDLLGELAIFHGHYWNDPRLDKQFTWLPTPLQLFTRFCETFSFHDQVFVGLQRAGHMVPDALKGRNERLWKAYGQSCAQSDHHPPRTLLHGDPHVGNTYITAAGKMGLNDWQVCMKGNWAWDFAYLLLTALPIEDRRNWERDLLTYYVERLKEHGGQPGSFDELWLDYRRHTLHALMGWLVTIGAGGVQPKQMQVDQVSLAVIERAAVAMVDLESIEALA